MNSREIRQQSENYSVDKHLTSLLYCLLYGSKPLRGEGLHAVQSNQDFSTAHQTSSLSVCQLAAKLDVISIWRKHSVLPSPSGSTARKCILFSSTASWKCSSVFSMIQRCISLAPIFLSLFISTLWRNRRQGWVFFVCLIWGSSCKF